jgi:putative SOS response-associated peptidase YedK
VYLQESDGNVIDFYKWGLVPPFATTEKTYSTFNCRKESLEDGSGIWNHAKQHQRCLVLVEGYYEWKKQGNHKTPYFITRKDGKLLCMAGMWDKNEKINPDAEEPLYTYTVITTVAHPGIRWLHDRMPVIFDPVEDKEMIDQWINPELKWKTNTKALLNSLHQLDSSKLDVYEVSKEVGKISNNYKELTLPISERQGTINQFFGSGGKAKKRTNEDSSSKQTKQPKTRSDQSPNIRNKESSPPKTTSGDQETTKSPPSNQSPSKNNKSPSKQKPITSFFSKKSG